METRLQIAIVTCSEPEPAKTEPLLLEPLARRGVDADIVAWDDIHADWSRFGAVVLSSTWDYHHRMREFRTWLNFLVSQGKQIINHVDVLRWNMDKFYLRKLEEAGVPILDSIFLNEGQPATLAHVMQDRGWKHAIVKPTIGAGGDGIEHIALKDAEDFQPYFEAMLAKQALIVQAYAPEIHEGEVSLVFFNGIYSHAALKRPAPHSIFVHIDRGGTSQRTHPQPSIIAQASACLRVTERLTKYRPVYARVDGIVREGLLHVMELELVEPELFLHMDADAPERFADAIVQRLSTTLG